MIVLTASAEKDVLVQAVKQLGVAAFSFSASLKSTSPWTTSRLTPRPWSIHVDQAFAADTDILEFVCQENERDRVHLTGK
jgi:hypothetical protein